MTDNITLRIGANASQAIREIGRVKKEAVGLKSMWGGFRGGLGIASAFGFGNLLAQITEPIRKGFSEAANQSKDFVDVMALMNAGLKEFGRLLADIVIPAFENFGWIMGAFLAAVRGPAAQAVFQAGWEAFKVRVQPGSGEMQGPQVPAGFQWEHERKAEEKKQIEKQTEYLRQMNDTLFSLERDISKSELFDPW
jgi:hypothetical protein